MKTQQPEECRHGCKGECKKCIERGTFEQPESKECEHEQGWLCGSDICTCCTCDKEIPASDFEQPEECKPDIKRDAKNFQEGFDAGWKEAEKSAIKQVKRMVEQPEECKGKKECGCHYTQKECCNVCEPEEPTLWEEFDEKFGILEMKVKGENVYAADAREAVKDFLKSKLLEYASEMRMEKEDERIKGFLSKDFTKGFNAGVQANNERLNTFISKLK